MMRVLCLRPVAWVKQGVLGFVFGAALLAGIALVHQPYAHARHTAINPLITCDTGLGCIGSGCLGKCGDIFACTFTSCHCDVQAGECGY